MVERRFIRSTKQWFLALMIAGAIMTFQSIHQFHYHFSDDDDDDHHHQSSFFNNVLDRTTTNGVDYPTQHQKKTSATTTHSRKSNHPQRRRYPPNRHNNSEGHFNRTKRRQVQQQSRQKLLQQQQLQQLRQKLQERNPSGRLPVEQLELQPGPMPPPSLSSTTTTSSQHDPLSLYDEEGLLLDSIDGSRLYDERSPRLRSRHKYVSECKLPLPILVIGFPKVGTSSLFSFFQRQGFASQHWYCCKPQRNPQKGGPRLMAGCQLDNLSQNRSILHGECGKSLDVFTELNGPRRQGDVLQARDNNNRGILLENGTYDYDTPRPRIFFPQHFHLDKLHEQYPNATWILNLRPVHDWVQSVLKWGDDLAIQFANEYYAKQLEQQQQQQQQMQQQNDLKQLPLNTTITTTNATSATVKFASNTTLVRSSLPSPPPSSFVFTWTRLREITKNTTDMELFLTTIYQEHTNYVLDFVQQYPSHTLVQLDITNSSARFILANSFGLQPQYWEQLNKLSHKVARQKRNEKLNQRRPRRGRPKNNNYYYYNTSFSTNLGEYIGCLILVAICFRAVGFM